MTVEEFKKIDTSFDEAMFMTKVNNIFIRLFTCIMLDKLEEVKHFLSTSVFEYACSITDSMREKKYRQMYDELNVKSSRITDIIVNQDVYTIKVFLQSRYMDYIMNLGNGSIVSGDNSSRTQVDYILTFTKKVDTKEQGWIRKCPGCGASLSVNTSGRCEYCGSSYNQEEYDWVLTELERK